ncbi:zinc finger protein ZAT11-like [Vigna unguiculata]|uniref:C2H2-type domain-containing protein n=1 Tax=Vigna unguiculata TaxID=3917 RepID=A0A4D6MZU8_VIGUN|nr:zinc finger protein ZAT11-like [Vigna unguiculata]QCE07043.1 hypothetical protein DEO72_LG9g2059 [Vigna unguiculata]
MKRQRESEGATLESWDITNCLTMTDKTVSATFPEEAFECRTCNRKFSSFQALGGHKKVKVVEEKEKHLKRTRSDPKTHMRRRRAINQVVAKVSVMKRSSNAKPFCFDLNLTPLQNHFNFFFFTKLSPKLNSH